ncbi:hypothetical protein H5410_061285 [Solanum commersonii]|uniref:Uncharacterized protein n=1 Tax=Solanum commersonii TaxID=4109 RepID=A0A9J5W857_SOLCO|nr:hypothetical protein H5410_061285 [Solanum commersonii]
MTKTSSSNPSDDMLIKYDLCLKNHATKFGDYLMDVEFSSMNSQSLYRPPVLQSLLFYPCLMTKTSNSNPSNDLRIKYGLCLKNHATKCGDYLMDVSVIVLSTSTSMSPISPMCYLTWLWKYIGYLSSFQDSISVSIVHQKAHFLLLS